MCRVDSKLRTYPECRMIKTIFIGLSRTAGSTLPVIGRDESQRGGIERANGSPELLPVEPAALPVERFLGHEERDAAERPSHLPLELLCNRTHSVLLLGSKSALLDERGHGRDHHHVGLGQI